MVSGPRGRLVEVYSLVCMTQLNSYASEFPLLPRSSMHPPAQLGVRLIVGASLSEPHTSVTALQDACVCLSVCVRT